MRDPDFTGAGAWRAWRCKLEPVGQRGRPDWDGTLAHFLVQAPGAHAFWSEWWISIMHLRDIPGVRPAVLQFAGAEHEILCVAQDPALKADPDDPNTARLLMPIDWSVQFRGCSDRLAIEVGTAVIRAIMSGTVSPDFASYWAKTIPATAACYASGTHERH
jgi:hypothetical protein